MAIIVDATPWLRILRVTTMRRTGVLLFLMALAVPQNKHSHIIAAQSPPEPLHQHATNTGMDRAGRSYAKLPIRVNGAETPELVPDDLAYTQFLVALSVRADAPKVDLARRNAMLAGTGLNTDDQKLVVAALVGVREQLVTISNQRRSLLTAANRGSVQAAAIADTLRAQERAVVGGARFRMTGTLSSDGFGILDRHIRTHVKRHIVIYGH